MKIPHSKRIIFTFFSFSLFTILSCSKDTDLLTDYVISEGPQSLVIANLAIADRFVVIPEDEAILDVLANDTFVNSDNVEIIKTSEPSNGFVLVNEDKTLTYIPKEVVSNVEQETTEDGSAQEEDSFTYTTESTNEDGTKETQEAEVNVTIGFGELKAFPTAEGYGKNTTGGRGGKVIHVTNLNDSGSGSLRDALQKSGTRTVVFDVSGYISLKSGIFIYNPNLTIAGQTAPGEGITIRGANISISTSNVIVRHLRIRPGLSSASNNSDCINIVAHSNNLKISNVILDHVSTSWSTDENMSLGASDSYSNNSVSNVTIQNCINAEPLEYYALLVGRNVTKLSIIRNLFANAPNRIPESSYGFTNEGYEFNNNIIYNYNRATTMAYGVSVDVIGNVYKAKQAPQSANITYNLNNITNPNGKPSDGSIYQTDNIQLGANSFGMTNDTWSSNNKNSRVHSSSPYQPIKATSVIRELLYDVGATVFNDPVDQRLITEYNGNTGIRGPKNESQVGGYPSLTKVTRPSGYDTDKDGMADEWELKYGLDPQSYEDGKQDRNDDGYTNLEEFLHSLTQ